MKDFFLFQKEIDPLWSPGKKWGYRLWNLGLVVLAGLALGGLSLLLATGTYPLSFAKGYLEKPVLLLLNLLPPVALILLLYGLTRRAGWAYLLTAAAVLGLSIGNYYKLALRDDPLMFGDLLLLKEAGNMAGKYELVVGKKLILAAVCALLGAAVLFLLARGRPGKGRGRWGIALAGLALAGAMTPPLMDSGLYNGGAAHYAHIQDYWSATQQYVAHGFLYPFLHSIRDTVALPPEGYHGGETAALLEQYPPADIPEGQKVNVMAIMLEAYNDFSKYEGLELAQDVYAVWHQLEEEGYSGDLMDNIFAGGTVDTERSFLTGFSHLPNFRGRTNSYPWYFRSQGYTVEGMHPCYQWFYNRLNINENLGFQDYKFVENYFGQFTDGKVAFDDLFFPELIKAYDKAKTQGPYFSFSVTYQGHGPYDTDVCWWGEKGEFVKPRAGRSDEEQYILDNYFGSVANTNENLKKLTDHLRGDEEPVVLALFGDHNPWLGDGNWVYHNLGIDLDLSSEEGFANYYGTRYLIWANDAAKEALGADLTGEGPAISPNYLMTQLFDLCGWTGPAYMQATREVKERVSVINVPTGLYVEDGALTDALSGEGERLVRQYEALEYYSGKHFLYEDLDR